ncbi:MAG: NADH-quinone oxidoreductase subunit NuoN [Hydrogenovibrio crunogenus]|uniref:NADH-quinone oxidoreductase subunit N n=1 Tax=Hydrogenovibrio crunogenus (strain DSM 25203 / XCL-2) TaxID=317025 RepID=NUON_HYDCU|nr:RecName: Full=NADH-quinone oxidoreductase subunit N; AltName: Full=NADH dehydrogenase I subunit N; AltName: Full=NDH-1 subunit N [Hydrogenovibrio crunogenus XCL-2]MBD3611581.1 NADH-quinone oxidoreductase subunit NuoN [Hydrogenovibrio crunogenus]
MNFVIPSFIPAIPEIVLLTLTSLLLIADTIWSKRSEFATYYATQLILLVVGYLVLTSFSTSQVLTFDGSFVRDAFGDILKLVIVVVSMGIFLFSKEYLLQNKFYRGEYFTLGLFGVLGMFVMVSAYNLITMYLGLEIMSLALYAMVAMRKDNQHALEAAMKYFVLGALATGMLLYGFSMIYGATGSIQFDEMAQIIASGNVDNVVLSFGVVFIVIGLAFKLGAVPFHMWVPDVYHGAPTAVTLYIGTAPKIAAFAMLYRILVEGLPGLVEDWQSLIVMISVLSLIVGAVITLVQENLKRLLAYSGIGHIGFILLGIIAANPDGYSAAMFYTIVYSITALAGFGMIVALARTNNEFDLVADFKGMNKRNPWLALMMLFIMFSMAGIPPFVGFYAKVVVIEEVVQAGFTWLAVLAVVMAVISAFYYLRVVKVMYFDEPEDNTKIEPVSSQLNWAVSFVSIALLLLGLMPSSLITLCYNSL